MYLSPFTSLAGRRPCFQGVQRIEENDNGD